MEQLISDCAACFAVTAPRLYAQCSRAHAEEDASWYVCNRARQDAQEGRRDRCHSQSDQI
eukprot:5287958-Prymnesium_polylepis.1